MKNFVKWGVASLLMAAMCVNFCSCSENDDDKDKHGIGNGDDNGKDNPDVGNGSLVVNPSNVFTGLMPKSVMGATFTYNSDGQVVEVVTEDGERLSFTYGSGLVSRAINPERTIKVVGEWFILNMEVGDNGFVRYCEEVYIDDEDDYEIDTWEFGYNSDGQLNYMKRSEGGNEVTNITYQNGNITKVKMRSEEDGEGSDYTVGYTSASYPTMIENKGCLMLFDETFGIDMDEMWYVYYAGLLGKPTKNLPAFLTETYSDSPSDTYIETFTWQFNSDGYPTKMVANSDWGWDDYYFRW
ncbi:MAG: DUF4595 domain-containing protein [Prevotellaceae bacterium]|nr:DUF4595 domain-containing protein [Prevotellaceae bacterium]